MHNESRYAKVSARVSDQIRDQLLELAERQGWTLSRTTAVLLADALARHHRKEQLIAQR